VRLNGRLMAVAELTARRHWRHQAHHGQRKQQAARSQLTALSRYETSLVNEVGFHSGPPQAFSFGGSSFTR
jgi:hypothetical protein